MDKMLKLRFTHPVFSYIEKLNEIKNIDALLGQSKLYYLSLYGNELSTIEPLKDSINLKYLYLDGNDIRDLTPLGNFTEILPKNQGFIINQTNYFLTIDYQLSHSKELVLSIEQLYEEGANLFFTDENIVFALNYWTLNQDEEAIIKVVKTKNPKK